MSGTLDKIAEKELKTELYLNFDKLEQDEDTM